MDYVGMDRLTAYGHSWVQGDGATGPAAGLVEVAAWLSGLVADNRGVGGTLSTETAALLCAEPPQGSSAYLLMTGLNDARLHGSSRAALRRYRCALFSILDTLPAASGDAVILAVEQPHLADYTRHAPFDRGTDDEVEAYNAELRLVARSYPRVRIVTVTGWDAHAMLSADTVHPNDAGHTAVAQAVASALEAVGAGAG